MEQKAEEEESKESHLGGKSGWSIHFYATPQAKTFHCLFEGAITPDDEEGNQEMGDPSLKVTEEMRDKANEERTQGSIAAADAPDDGNQVMGDPSLEVTEEMSDKAYEELTKGSIAAADGA